MSVNKKAIIYSDSDAFGSTYEVTPIPDEYKDMIDRAYDDLVEQVGNLDDEVGTLFLEEKPVTPQDLKAGIRRLTIANKFIPVAGGSAFKNKGVQYLVDAVVDYLPSPLDIPPARGIDPDTHEEKFAPTDDNGDFCSLAFKLWSDPFVGKLVFFRVYSGKLSKGDTVYNPRTSRRERISRLIQIQADKREDIQTCYSGDIAAIVGVKNITTGDTLCDNPIRSSSSLRLSRSRSSRWQSSRRQSSIKKKWRPLFRGCQKKIRLSAFTRTKTLGRPLSPAWVSLHLEIIRDRMLREFKVDANAGKASDCVSRNDHQKRYRRGQIDQTIRRPWSIWTRRGERGTAEARRGSNDREQDRGRRDSEGVHPCGEERD